MDLKQSVWKLYKDKPQSFSQGLLVSGSMWSMEQVLSESLFNQKSSFKEMLKVLEIEGAEQYPFITILMKILLNIFVLIQVVLSGKEPTCKCRRLKRHRFDPWVGKIHWRKAWQSTPVFLPGESHEQASMAGYKPLGCKESDTSEATQQACSTMYCFKIFTNTYFVLGSKLCDC